MVLPEKTMREGWHPVINGMIGRDRIISRQVLTTRTSPTAECLHWSTRETGRMGDVPECAELNGLLGLRYNGK
jgi:hypothetical protein